MLFGREPKFPADVALKLPSGDTAANDVLGRLSIAWDLAREQIRKEQDKYKLRFDQHRSSFEFAMGDLVLLRDITKSVGKSPKLQPLYKGPYRIIEKLSPLNYKIRILSNGNKKADKRRNDELVVHIDRLKPFEQETDESDKENTPRVVQNEETPVVPRRPRRPRKEQTEPPEPVRRSARLASRK